MIFRIISEADEFPFDDEYKIFVDNEDDFEEYLQKCKDKQNDYKDYLKKYRKKQKEISDMLEKSAIKQDFSRYKKVNSVFVFPGEIEEEEGKFHFDQNGKEKFIVHLKRVFRVRTTEKEIFLTYEDLITDTILFDEKEEKERVEMEIIEALSEI